MMNFKCETKQEYMTIGKIAARAATLAAEAGVKYEQMDAVMDVTAAHCNGCPLQLDELLNADEGNFGHDVFGIRRHIDRRTGKLGGCFLPRFAQPEEGAA